ncbi:MAG: cell envelope integrity protein TolA [Saprospiraceae bacterium]|nr:cell envelope integrity protein TolA [Saprospiraceae bacterium]
MMYQQISLTEKENKRRGLITSIIIHALVLLIAILPLLSYPDPPPGQEGILVSFGGPDIGMGDSKPDTQQEEVVEPKPPSEEEQKTVTDPVASPTTPVETQKDVVTAEDPNVAAIKKREEERKKVVEDERRRDKEAKEKAEIAEKERKADEARKQAEYDKAKKQFGDAFGGSGKGSTDKAGNQGDPKGDPNAKNLEGISTGKGNIGGGLSGRGVVYQPTITDKSQKTGIVVVNICVNNKGEVTRATYTRRAPQPLIMTSAELLRPVQRSSSFLHQV